MISNVLPLAPPPQTDPWDRLKSLALDGLSSGHSRRAYNNALDDFRRWSVVNGPSDFSRATVQRYRAALEVRGLRHRPLTFG